MTILVGTKRWSKPKPPPTRSYNRSGELTLEERECTLLALKYLIARLGSIEAVAARMRVNRWALSKALHNRRRLRVDLALGISRAAGVTIDDVITGRYPAPGACPHCGRSDEAVR